MFKKKHKHKSLLFKSNVLNIAFQSTVTYGPPHPKKIRYNKKKDKKKKEMKLKGSNVKKMNRNVYRNII